MEKDGLIKNIRESLTDKRSMNTLKKIDRADRSLMKDIDAVASTRDVGLAFRAFGVLLQDKKEHKINDKRMAESIDKALREWDGSMITLPKVYSPELYRCVDEEHRVDSKKVNGRPKDQVRVFLTAQKARTQNECKGESGDGYKAFLNAQIMCLSMMEREYKKLQDKAMGVVPEVKKSKDKGMER